MSEIAGPVVVMTVDDEPENLNVLDEILRHEGWEVRAFVRGEQALAAAREQPPDLVLLDIRMPGLDGYETCRRFKFDVTLQAIPIIFLSAYADAADKIRAFEAGGVDYVTKPFSELEVLARARAQIRLHRYQHRLESMVEERMVELAEAHRRLRIWDDAKNDWLNMLSHELRTPLTGIFGITDLLFRSLPPDSRADGLCRAYDDSRRRIEKLIDDAGMLAQLDVASANFFLQPVSVAQSLETALNDYAKLQPAVAARAELDVAETVMVRATPNLLRRGFTDLCLTAACCVDDGESISVKATCDQRFARLTIITDGHGLARDAVDSFFEVGGQRTLLKGGGDFGLGAALARRIVQLFKGSVQVRNGAVRGIVLTASLPLDDKPARAAGQAAEAAGSDEAAGEPSSRARSA